MALLSLPFSFQAVLLSPHSFFSEPSFLRDCNVTQRGEVVKAAPLTEGEAWGETCGSSWPMFFLWLFFSNKCLNIKSLKEKHIYRTISVFQKNGGRLFFFEKILIFFSCFGERKTPPEKTRMWVVSIGIHLACVCFFFSSFVCFVFR